MNKIKFSPGRLVRRAAAVLLMASMSVPAMPVMAAENTDTVEARVEEIMKDMSTRDKITQMFMIDFRQWNDAQGNPVDFTVMNDDVAKILEDYHFGSVIYFANNIKETEQSFNLTKELQAHATKNGGIPLLIATDQEGGIVARLGSGTSLPGNMALGADGSLDDAKKAGEIIGSELSSLAINTTLSPVVDVNNNPNNPVIGLRSFGDDPTKVGELASAVISGLDEYGVIGCAKHFPGHGDTETDSHYGLPKVEKEKSVLMENELKPYQVAISKGIDMIMSAHILYPGLDSSTIVSNKTGQAENLPATMSKAILTDLLKGELGFKGIVCTDAMNMAGISDKWDQVQAAVVAMEAGADLLCMPVSPRSNEDMKALDAVIDGALDANKKGKLSDERLDDAVERILTVKAKKGILDYNPDDYSIEKAKEIVGGTENRAAEREIAARAVTVVKNEKNVLPLKVEQSTKGLALLPLDNEPALAVMGWNRAKEDGIVPKGSKFDYAVYNNVAELTDELKAKIDAADQVLVVTGVSNASSMNGKTWHSALPLAATKYCKEKGKVSVVISADKPYDVQSYADADAIMAVYGCKGSAADPTEALVGGIVGTAATYGPNIIAGVEVALGTFGASGTLPVKINKFDAASGKYTDEVVYERGYGLTYKSKNDENRKAMYRLYNPNSGEHFYTKNSKEADYLISVGWNDEQTGWYAPIKSDRPVYRVYNPNAGDHHYTDDSVEKDRLIGLGWKDEGIGWYSADESGVPLYRQYNPNAKVGTHNFTADKNENDYLKGVGWREEGIAWYALADTSK